MLTPIDPGRKARSRDQKTLSPPDLAFHSAGIKQAFLILVLLGLGAFALSFVPQGFHAAWMAWQSGHWPTTTGTVTLTTLKTTHSSGRHGGYHDTPVVHYSYVVGGTTYNGDEIAPGRMWNSGATIPLKLFPLGSHPAVYYSPNHPEQAVLMPGLHLYNLEPALLAATGITFVLTYGLCSLLARIENLPAGPSGIDFPSGSLGGKVFVIGFLLLAVEVVLLFIAARY